MDVRQDNKIIFHAYENILLFAWKGCGTPPTKFIVSVDGKEVPKPYLGTALSTKQDYFFSAYVEDLASKSQPTIELLDENDGYITVSRRKRLRPLAAKDLGEYSLADRAKLWKTLFHLAPGKFPFITEHLLDDMTAALATEQGCAYTLGSNASYWRLPWPESEERQSVPIEIRIKKPSGKVNIVSGEAYVLDQWLHWVSMEENTLPEKGCVGLMRSKGGVCMPFQVSRVTALPPLNSKKLNLKRHLDLGDQGLLHFVYQSLQGQQRNGSKVNGIATSAVTLKPKMAEAPRRITSTDLNIRNAAYPYFGRLENLRTDRLNGWALSLNAPNVPIRLDILINNTKLCEITTSLKIQTEDNDRDLDVRGEKAGFSISLADYLTLDLRQKMTGIDELSITARIHGTDVELANTPLKCPARQILDQTSRATLFDESRKTKITPQSYQGQIDSIRGRHIKGWVLDRNDASKRLELEFYLESQYVGRTTASLWREDLRAFLPDNPRHGFEFVIPEKHLLHLVGERATLTVREQTTKQTVFNELKIDGLPRPHPPSTTSIRCQLDKIYELLKNIESEIPQLRYQSTYHIDEYDEYFRQYYTITDKYRRDMRYEIARFKYAPRISIILVVQQPEIRSLDETIRSVLNQTYENFELCIVDDGTGDDAVRELVKQYCACGPRIIFQAHESYKGHAATSNTALTLADGEYVAFINHGDVLSEDALFCVVKTLQNQRHVVIYSDEDQLDLEGNHVKPMFKPDFNYDLLLSQNYIRHFLIVDITALRRIGGSQEEYKGCENYSLLLRLAEDHQASAFFHIPRVLYHCRSSDDEELQTSKERRVLLEKIATTVQAHLDRCRMNAMAVPDHDILEQHGIFATRIFWPMPEPSPIVSIIIPTKDAINLVSGCIASILSSTEYQNYEIILIDHASVEPLSKDYFASLAVHQNIRILHYRGVFNWSAINNYAVSQAKGEILVFLNNDTVVLSRKWLTELVSHALRPDIGAVGAKLLYDDGTIQHAGVYLGIGGLADHAFSGEASTAKGYMGRAVLTADMSAVTGACLACRREVFDQVSGFDAVNLKVAFNDVDFCMKITDAGYRIVWTPHALLYHLESKSRGVDDTPEKLKRVRDEIEFMKTKWGKKLLSDPFYNIHFELINPYLFTYLASFSLGFNVCLFELQEFDN